ncbi:hypothetical protein G6F65_022487 [Rhizopus arrhizus]|nr:hypothetical protein G6F65_022487 [Rhizopus arrhizus]
MHRRRQRSHRLLEIGAEVQLARLDALVQVRAFAHQRTADRDQRQDDQQQDQQQGDQCAKIAAPADTRNQPALQGRKDDGKDGAPENGAVERPQ